MQDASPSPAPFELDPRLHADTRLLADLELCRLVLMNDRRWPWAILVPRRTGVVEITDLTAEERALLVEEAARVAGALRETTGAEKTNVATLGNAVRQFHLHVVARREGDPNWPGPVWGFGQREPWNDEEAGTFAARLLERL
ncbi:HIT domain-containing protein [Aureimonas jatrophae]|uniref:Diadenosine tetraphosphate (Ap4A) hydrolase n=1 Tax=Aureimonas jatrophae TaxID=1166073 RepID=A0A1H0LVE4_9HYPH|nr:HIT family protein [Aureimonas jatrophae]MBB3952768.1 diadenosine tetraphosphate (Ap4A) HIT family hydrolase [Aureimonas jatrophae]SDO72209.1 Diadenosine tetraphosphate (Ap4A) hydrolase [Aureimonas jatrophae]